MGIGGAAAPELFDAVNPGLECADTPGLSNEHPPSCFFKQPTMLRELSNTIRCLSDCCPGWVFLSSAKAKWPQSFFNALKLGAHFPRATMDYWWWYHSELNHNVRSDPRLVSGEKKYSIPRCYQLIHSASTSAVNQHLSSCVRQKVTIDHSVLLMTCCKKTMAAGDRSVSLKQSPSWLGLELNFG